MSSVDARDARDEPGALGVHGVRMVDGDTQGASASAAGDAVSDAPVDPPDTDAAVALAATELRLRLGAVAASAGDDAGQAKAATTLRASRADWADCTAWCDRHALPPLPTALAAARN